MPIECYQPRILERSWGEEIFIAETPHYVGKILNMRAGTYGGLQRHVEKIETFHLVSGDAIVRYGDESGQLQAVTMRPGESYHVPAGADHQVIAVSDCVFFETSTAHYDDRIRREAYYGLPDTGGLPTTK